MLELFVVIVRALALACRGHRELVLENLALRQQLTALRRTTKRAHLKTRDRLFWIALARSWRNWRTALVLVQPDTVVRWHRDWLRRRWTRRSKRRPDGRPPIDQQIRALVRDMASANPLSEVPRSHGELRALGVDVSERTVSRQLEPHARPPSQTWRMFLTNHLASAASMFFSPFRQSSADCCSSWSCCHITAGGSCTSTSRNIRQPRGPLSKWSKHSRTTPRPGGCIETGTTSMATSSGGDCGDGHR